MSSTPAHLDPVQFLLESTVPDVYQGPYNIQSLQGNLSGRWGLFKFLFQVQSETLVSVIVETLI